MDRQQRLRIAVQKSGRLTDASLDLLQRCAEVALEAYVA